MNTGSAHQQDSEQVVRLNDPLSGLAGMIVIDSTRLGAAAGGCRFWSYASEEAVLGDALRLARGMTYKNALAGLPFGGGKAVIRRPNGPFDRGALFRAFGRAVEELGGRYVTAEDVGTGMDDMKCVREQTRHVAGLPARAGAPGGDPSPWTALGVFLAMEVAVKRRLGRELSGVTVAVQGLGNVGFALCKLLHEAGARLIAAEPRADMAGRAALMFGAEIVSSPRLLAAEAEVFAPCALGGVLDADAVGKLRAKIVCGAANNQLATPEEGAALARRGILYAPDYVVNSGGIINVAAEHLGWSEEEARLRVEAIGRRLAEVLDLAEASGADPHLAADTLARSVVAGERAPSARAA